MAGIPVLYIAIFASVCFGLAAIYLSWREEKVKKELEEKNKELGRKVYELSISREVFDKIGYSLNVRNVAESIASTAESHFKLTTISYAVRENDKLIVRTFMKEAVTSGFTDKVKELMLAAVKEISPDLAALPTEFSIADEYLSNINQPFDTVPHSYFNVPLFVKEKLVGMITIASREEGIYQEEDINMLFRIIKQTGFALEKLESLIETEKTKLESFIASLPHGAMLFSPNDGTFNLTLINSSASNFMSIGDTPTKEEVFKGFGDENKLEERLHEVVSGKKSLILKEVFINEKFYNVIVTPVFFHETEKIIGVSVIMRGITVEKELETLRDTFTHTIVHELRSPLASIKGSAELLLKGKVPEDEKEKMLAVIKSSAERMISQVSDLLDSAKLDAGKLSIVKEATDINEVIKNSVELFSSSATLKHINIFMELDDKLPKIMLDAARIGQVLNNLISNSIKYTPEEGKVTVKSRQEGGNLELLVEDTGMGIAEEKKALLFSKFATINNKSLNDGGQTSTGLGLYITKGIVEAHGGKIWVESELGKGTKTFVSIPIEVGEEKPAESSTIPEETQEKPQESSIAPGKFLN